MSTNKLELAKLQGFVNVTLKFSDFVATLPLESVAVPVIVTVNYDKRTSLGLVDSILKSSLFVTSFLV